MISVNLLYRLVTIKVVFSIEECTVFEIFSLQDNNPAVQTASVVEGNE